MTKERLQSFSSNELQVIAKKAGLDVDNDNKDFLIDEIIEAYAEDKIERQTATNMAMIIKQKKFELILDDDEISLNQDNVTDVYGKQVQSSTEMHFMLRDPHWGFAYWSMSKKDISIIKENGSALYLRVYQAEDGGVRTIDHNGDFELDFFDLSITLNDSRWYVNLPDSGVSYIVELISELNGSEKILCKSNMVFSPSLTFDERMRDNIDDMIISSGLYESFSRENNFYKNSHRIMSIEDSKYITQELKK